MHLLASNWKRTLLVFRQHSCVVSGQGRTISWKHAVFAAGKVTPPSDATYIPWLSLFKHPCGGEIFWALAMQLLRAIENEVWMSITTYCTYSYPYQQITAANTINHLCRILGDATCGISVLHTLLHSWCNSQYTNNPCTHKLAAL